MTYHYECQNLHMEVFQPPNVVPEPHYPAPLFVQLEVTITLKLERIQHYCLIDEYYMDTDDEPFFSEETVRFDLHLVKDQRRVTEILGSMLTRLAIPPYSRLFNDVLGTLIQHGLRLSNCTSSMGRIVLPLHAYLRGAIMLHFHYAEPDNILGVWSLSDSESESEFETSNYGMLPAKDLSVKEMLKRVGVRGGEDCVICLEELEVGSDASEMPCFHTFHENCIKKWLKKSHYCPICRFELPT